MRLIQLASNKTSFRTVRFNETGATFIVARQKHPESADAGKTYNGVGKSLTVALIHFCLGSSKKPGLEKAIPGWDFILTFKIGEKTYVSKRNTSLQNKIKLNETELSLKDFKEQLEVLVFAIPENAEYLTLRTIIPRFIRPNKAAYVSFDKVRSQESDYESLICCGYLLGLNIDLIIKKKTLKRRRDKIEELKSNLNKDPIF